MKNPTDQQTEQQEATSQEWDLLTKATDQKAGPMFSRNVMRSIRLEQAEQQESSSSPWWKSLFSLKPMIGATAGVACALLALPLLMSEPTSTTAKPPNLAKHTVEPTQLTSTEADEPIAQSDLEMMIEDDEMAAEVLIAMFESPELFANQEVFEMIGL